MKLFLVALASCLIGTSVGLSALFLTEDVGAADLFGFVPVMFIAAVLMCALSYAPGLCWLRQRKGCESASAFLLAAGFVLNAPVFLFFLFAMSIGKFFSGLSEVMLFTTAFVAAGLAFGGGFVRYNCGQKVAAG